MTSHPTDQTVTFAVNSYPVNASASSEADLLARPTVLAERTAPVWLDAIKFQLASLTTLEANWDSYGGSPVDRHSISQAQSLIDYLARFVGVDEPAVGATPDGEAGLSWDGGPWSLDVDVTSTGRYEYVYTDDRDSTRDVEAYTRDANELLQFLTSWSQ